ncbi:MAG TPA: nucleotidyl transferase, partial [Chloroflexota bacterium]|nr:nucleotidyl transferase [Chloroflexota bacterium]
GWNVLAAIYSLLGQDQPGGVIAVPVQAPHVFEAIAARHGGKVIRTKSDTNSLMVEATNPGVVLAGDGNGGIIFPEFQPAMDAMFSVIKLIEILARHDAVLSEVVEQLPRYHVASAKVSCPWENKGRVMRLLSQQYQSEGPRSPDGVRIDLSDREWVLVLPDPDRPLFHVIAEAGSNDAARSLMDKYSTLVSNLQR